MGKVLEAHFIADIDGFLFLLHELVVCQLQAFSCQPPLWSGVKGLSKVAFKSSKAAAGEVAEFLQGQVEHEVPLHIRDEVDFSRLLKIGQHIIDAFVDASQDADCLGYF